MAHFLKTRTEPVLVCLLVVLTVYMGFEGVADCDSIINRGNYELKRKIQYGIRLRKLRQ